MCKCVQVQTEGGTWVTPRSPLTAPRAGRVTVIDVLLLGAFDFQDRNAFIGATVGADMMREAHAAALLALDEVHWLKSIMGAAAVATTLGQFAFWLRCQLCTP